MMRKLKYLKVKIQEWNNRNRNNTKRAIEKYKEELDALEAAIDKGCNSSFIALIPKILDANLAKDFRPISLIGSIYKIIKKTLATRLVGVLGNIVNERVVDAGMFMGIKLSPSLNLSHMFYADDAVFVGQWHESGMIYVTGASLEGGCRKGSMLIFHMSIFRVPLSVLCVLESIHSHFFNGHELRSNKATWVKWNSVLASKEKGGLDVSSLYALNRGLMLKWVWRHESGRINVTDASFEGGCR
nr:RNA-directed DNA polymerase, eukaryota, reverse transcriptase zinc-binding domain protein [Tanacetum cinerariifolium]